MDQSTNRSERITAIISTLVAVAILGVGVKAQQSRNAPIDELVHLESDLRFQLKSAFRLNPKQGAHRVKQVDAVLVSWRGVEHTTANRDLLADWLLEATIHSMPGSIKALPPAPEFISLESAGSHPGVRPQETASETSDRHNIPAVNSNTLDSADGLPTGSAVVPVSVASTDAIEARSPVESAPSPALPSPVEASKVEPQPHQPLIAEPVQIDLKELTARIAGYHGGLAEIEAALLVLERADYKTLSRHVHSLDGLTKDFQFVRLYYESLTPEERKAIQPPRTMDTALADMRRHFDKLEREIEADFLGEYETDLTEKLGQLRKQLDAIARRVDW